MKRLALFVVSLMLFAGLGFSQDEPEPQTEHGPIFAVGGGSFFGEEEETFSEDALFVSAQWHGLDIPKTPEALDTASGVAIELGKSSLASGLDDIVVRLWSINRMQAGNFVTGFDMKLTDADGFDFDKRITVGYLLHPSVILEVYSLEEQRPIAWALMYRF